MDFGPVLVSLMEPGTIIEQQVLKETTIRLEDATRKSASLVSLGNESYGICNQNLHYKWRNPNRY